MFGLFGVAAIESELRKEKNGARRGRDTGNKKGRGMRAVFSVFPLLAIPVIIYNIIALGVPSNTIVTSASGNSVAPLLGQLSEVMISISMLGTVTWELTGGDLMILLSIGLLFLEILKSTGTGTATIMNHAVSMLLFIICMVQFLLLSNFATSVFFIIMVMTLLDVLAGVVVTIVSARRDFAVGGG